MKKIYWFFILLVVFSCYQKSQKKQTLVVSNFLFIFENPEWKEIEERNFPFDLIYPDSQIVYLLHLERTGIWHPDQYAVLLKMDQNPQKVTSYYKKILQTKDWQILQSKHIQHKNNIIYFLNAQDFFNRNLSIIIKGTKKRSKVKIYIKKLTDE